MASNGAKRRTAPTGESSGRPMHGPKRRPRRHGSPDVRRNPSLPPVGRALNTDNLSGGGSASGGRRASGGRNSLGGIWRVPSQRGRGPVGGELIPEPRLLRSVSPPIRLDALRKGQPEAAASPGRPARRVCSATGAMPCSADRSLAALRSTECCSVPGRQIRHKVTSFGWAGAAIKSQHDRMPCGVRVSNSQTVNNYRMTTTAQHPPQKFIPCTIESSLHAPNVVPERPSE